MACQGTRLWDWAASLAPEREGAACGLGRCASGAVPLLCCDQSRATASDVPHAARLGRPLTCCLAQPVAWLTAREAVMAPGTVGVTVILKVSAPSVFAKQSHCIMTFEDFARHGGGIGEREKRGQGMGSRACGCQ
jgi:hypothetical protein